MNELELKILDFIEKRYNRKYNGGLKVTKLGVGPTGYKLILYLGNEDHRPIQISADLNAEDFLKFIEQELISRQLIRVQWFKGIKKYPEDEERRVDSENRQSYL